MLVPIRMPRIMMVEQLLCMLLHASNGHESCVRALLDAGADKDAKDNDGSTALMYASENGHESCVMSPVYEDNLVDAGADNDAKYEPCRCWCR